MIMAKITRLVIADDSPRARHGQCAVLAIQPGIKVVGEAADGEEAIRLIETLRPDGVIMDICMPGMDGIQATRLIKCRWPEIKVIIMSMYAAYRFEALATGADIFLEKGCPVEELVNALR